MAVKVTVAPMPTILPVAGGDTAFVDVPKQGVQTHAFRLTAQAQVDVTVAATRRRNKGSVWALFDQVVLSDNGKARVELDGRILRKYAEMHAPSALAASRLAGVGVQAATIIREQAILHLANPLSGNPQETAWKERDSQRKVQLGVRVPATPKNRLMEAGTATVTNIQVTCEQVYDPVTTDLPLFLPTIRQITQNIPGTNTKLEVELKSPNWLRGLIVQQDSDAGEVGDIISALAFRGQFRPFIGEDQVAWDDLLRSMEAEFGGQVYDGPGTAIEQSAYWLNNAQQGGRLSNIISPAELAGAKLVLSVAQTGAAGATAASSLVRVALIELERPSGLVTPDLPFVA